MFSFWYFLNKVFPAPGVRWNTEWPPCWATWWSESTWASQKSSTIIRLELSNTGDWTVKSLSPGQCRPGSLGDNVDKIILNRRFRADCAKVEFFWIVKFARTAEVRRVVTDNCCYFWDVESVTASQASDGGHERLWWWQWAALGSSSWWQQTFRQMSNLPATPRPRMLHFTPSLNHISHCGSHSPRVSQLPRRPGSKATTLTTSSVGFFKANTFQLWILF